MKELMDFGKEMFPETTMSVYVPPSNVLSEAGRKTAGFPVSQDSYYCQQLFSGDYAYVQEFEVAEDGIVEQRVLFPCDH